MIEIENGQKRLHWMWFVFPQIDDLGTSETVMRYAIKNFDEAVAYLNHPVFGARILQCCAALLTIKNKSAVETLGAADAVKLQSSITLFSIVAPERLVFVQVLEKYYNGIKYQRTIDIIHSQQNQKLQFLK